MNSSSISDDYEKLSNDLTSLYMYWKLFNELYRKNKFRTDLMEKLANHFFGITHRLLIDAILLGLARITDPPESGKNKNLVIRRLQNEVLSGNLINSVANELDDKIKAIEMIREKILPNRHKRIAHRDYDFAYGRHVLQVTTFDEVGKMLLLLCDYMNSIAKILSQTPVNYEAIFVIGDDFAQIITQLRRADAYLQLEQDRKVPRMIMTPEPE